MAERRIRQPEWMRASDAQRHFLPKNLNIARPRSANTPGSRMRCLGEVAHCPSKPLEPAQSRGGYDLASAFGRRHQDPFLRQFGGYVAFDDLY